MAEGIKSVMLGVFVCALSENADRDFVQRIMLTPFQHTPRMTKEYADSTWQVLEDAIHKIHSHNSSRLSFEELYRLDGLGFKSISVMGRNAYNMVLHRFGERLYNGLTATLQSHLEQVADGIESSRGESFLREMEQSWEEHLKSTQMIRDILMVLDFQLCWN